MIEDIMRNNLIALAQAYASHKKLSLATVSKDIHGNQAFLEQFYAGKCSTRLDTYDAMVNRLRLRWPKELAWPKTAPIPKLGKKVDDGFPER